MSNYKSTIAIMTSGGDAPGMNAAIQGAYANAVRQDFRILGIKNGFSGLIRNQLFELSNTDVHDICRCGGTILGTSRCSQFRDSAIQQKAADTCRYHNVEAVIVIGGDGSFQGASKLYSHGIGVVGIPATIDMDIGCTEYTLGFDTAVNSAMEAIDKIQETSQAHSCCSVVEVMGRHAGYNALWCGIANTAQMVLVPEKQSLEQLIRHLHQIHFTAGTIIVAEGAAKAEDIAARIAAEFHIHTRANVLGFLQRGGSPTCRDRLYGFLMGAYAVDMIDNGRKHHVIAMKNGEVTNIEISEALSATKPFPEYVYELQTALGGVFQTCSGK